jgi:DNA-binding NarL/FixJ family response regulator
MQELARANGRSLAVLLVDDDAMARSWVRFCVRGSELRVAAEASSARETLDLASRRTVDVLLVDQRLPDRSGTELIRELRRGGVLVPAIVMSRSVERGLNEDARDCGAHGTLLKTGSAEELLGALRAVARGERAFDGRYPRRDAARAALSPREREILGLVASGRTNREISVALGVGDETVKTLLSRTFVKLGARRRAHAVAAAHERGLL